METTTSFVVVWDFQCFMTELTFEQLETDVVIEGMVVKVPL